MLCFAQHDSIPTTNDQRPTTHDRRPTTNDPRSTTNDQPLASHAVREFPLGRADRRAAGDVAVLFALRLDVRADDAVAPDAHVLGHGGALADDRDARVDDVRPLEVR